MDPIQNPYAPGAGTPPPDLAGRDDVIKDANTALLRTKGGKAARGLIFYGLRGVGKTVLLQRIRKDAEEHKLIPVVIEAPEDRSLPAVLGPALRATLIRMSVGKRMAHYLGKALGALASFAKAAKIKYQDVEFNVDFSPEAGTADSGDLDMDLADLLSAVGEAAKEAKTAVVLIIDELQYIQEDQLAALITALHKANQSQLPITLIAAGLPQLLGQLGKAKSYAERLFQFAPIGALSVAHATQALCNPAAQEGVHLSRGAVNEILMQTACYPYFLQEWGKHAWAVAKRSPITQADAIQATTVALAELDASFFRVRFDRLTPAEKRYMRAMAELGPGPHRSGDVADVLGKTVNLVAPVRSKLIAKGMAYCPSHGDIAFTVPLFDGFMRRTIPTLD